MSTLAPFAALRPPAELAKRVAAPPYDVVSTKEARALVATGDSSYLLVSRPEVGLPDGVDEHADAVYAEGPRALARLLADGALVADPAPSLYLYAQTMGAHRQLGVVGCVSVDEYDRDVIKKHEKTRRNKEDDRARHIDELGAHDEPVFLTYRADREIDALVARVTASPASPDFVTADGVRHEVWVVPPDARDALVAAFAARVPALYVADGHHRSAAASRVHARRRGTAGEHGVFLAVLFPDDQLQILAYNRLVRDSRGRSAAELRAALEVGFELAPAASPAPPRAGTFGLYLGGEWLLATPREAPPDDPVGALDCSVCQTKILSAVFGIDDPRVDDRVDFVGGIRGAAELERRVRDEGWSLAIHLYPTSVAQLLAVSDAGQLMPPKSTWFEPKLRSGLFVHRFQ